MKKSDLALLAFIIVIYVAFFTNIISTASVEGVSMYPVFQNGALTFYQPPTNISYGTIIIYKATNGVYIIHRVIEINQGHYITQGVDNISNPYPDNRNPQLQPPEGVAVNNVIGKVTEINGYVISIPYLGYLSIIASSII